MAVAFKPDFPVLQELTFSFARAEVAGAGVAYEAFGSQGLAIINPLAFGVTLSGLRRAPGRRMFLGGMAAGQRLIAYDQRGYGNSGGEPSVNWDERGADVWLVADALGIERAVLYGTFDAGHTILHAATQQPERVLGLILNFVPASFDRGRTGPGTPPSASLERWFPREPEDVRRPVFDLLRDLGLDDQDALNLSICFRSSRPMDTPAVMPQPLSAAFPGVTTNAVLLQPRRPLFRGWAQSLLPVLPRGRVVETRGAIQALGAIHAFLARIAAEDGQEASSLNPLMASAAMSSQSEVERHRRIVVTVDEDDSSGRTVELACRLGEFHHASIVLTHVSLVPYCLPLDCPPPEAVASADRALTLGRAIVGKHRLSCQSRQIGSRKLATALTTVARETEASLVIIGARGNSLEDDVQLTETVRDIVRRGECEVLVDRG